MKHGGHELGHGGRTHRWDRITQTAVFLVHFNQGGLQVPAATADLSNIMGAS